MKFAMKVKAIELYSEKEAKLTLAGERCSMAFIYLPIEQVGEFTLGQEFQLAQM